MKAVGCREGPMSAFRDIRQRGKGSKIYGGGQKVMARKKELGTGIITETDRYLYGEGTHWEPPPKLTEEKRACISLCGLPTLRQSAL